MDFSKQLLFSFTPKIFFLLSGASMKTTRTPLCMVPGSKGPRLPMSLIVHYCFASSSSSPTGGRKYVFLFHPPSFHFFTDSSLCVCCKTLATEVNIHDFGVFPTEWFQNSAHESTIDDFVALFSFSTQCPRCDSSPWEQRTTTDSVAPRTGHQFLQSKAMLKISSSC